MNAQNPPKTWRLLNTQEREEYIRTAAFRKQTVEGVAQALGVGPQEIYKFIAQQEISDLRWGKRIFDTDSPWAKMTAEERDQRLVQPGSSQAALSQELGVSISTLRSWRRRRNLGTMQFNSSTNALSKINPESPRLWQRLSAEERIAHIREQDARGVFRSEQAKNLGIKRSTLSDWAVKNGIQNENLARTACVDPQAPWHKASADQRKALIQEGLVKTGSQAELSDWLKVGRDTVVNFARKHRVKLAFLRPKLNPLRTPGSGRAPQAHSDAINPSAKRPAPDTPTRVHFFDAKQNQCRFPLWGDGPTPPVSELFFCGAPTVPGEKTSYCEHCTQIIRRRVLSSTELQRMAEMRRRIPPRRGAQNFLPAKSTIIHRTR